MLIFVSINLYCVPVCVPHCVEFRHINVGIWINFEGTWLAKWALALTLLCFFLLSLLFISYICTFKLSTKEYEELNEFEKHLVGQVSLGSDSSGGGGVAKETPIWSSHDDYYDIINHCHHQCVPLFLDDQYDQQVIIPWLCRRCPRVKGQSGGNGSCRPPLENIFRVVFKEISRYSKTNLEKTLNHQSGGWGDSKSPQGGLV